MHSSWKPRNIRTDIFSPLAYELSKSKFYTTGMKTQTKPNQLMNLKATCYPWRYIFSFLSLMCIWIEWRANCLIRAFVIQNHRPWAYQTWKTNPDADWLILCFFQAVMYLLFVNNTALTVFGGRTILYSTNVYIPKYHGKDSLFSWCLIYQLYAQQIYKFSNYHWPEGC